MALVTRRSFGSRCGSVASRLMTCNPESLGPHRGPPRGPDQVPYTRPGRMRAARAAAAPSGLPGRTGPRPASSAADRRRFGRRLELRGLLDHRSRMPVTRNRGPRRADRSKSPSSAVLHRTGTFGAGPAAWKGQPNGATPHRRHPHAARQRQRAPRADFPRLLRRRGAQLSPRAPCLVHVRAPSTAGTVHRWPPGTMFSPAGHGRPSNRVLFDHRAHRQMSSWMRGRRMPSFNWSSAGRSATRGDHGQPRVDLVTLGPGGHFAYWFGARHCRCTWRPW